MLMAAARVEMRALLVDSAFSSTSQVISVKRRVRSGHYFRVMTEGECLYSSEWQMNDTARAYRNKTHSNAAVHRTVPNKQSVFMN